MTTYKETTEADKKAKADKEIAAAMAAYKKKAEPSLAGRAWAWLVGLTPPNPNNNSSQTNAAGVV